MPTVQVPPASWEEVYGPDYPWIWLTAGFPGDCPVLTNQLVQVRYDNTNNVPGFKVDVWNGSAFVEQGKMTVVRVSDVGANTCDTWVSAGLVEYTPDRTVLSVVLSAGPDAFSRERVFVSVQRGEVGAIFEVYPGRRSDGTAADARLVWTPAPTAGAADLNASAMKIDSQGTGSGLSWAPGGPAVYVATAGTGAGTGNSGQFGADAALGATSFASSENWVAILRCPVGYATVGAYQAGLVVLQGANAQARYGGANTSAYGVSSNAFRIVSQNNAGYVQAQLFFVPTKAQQVMEAEAMTLGTGTSSTADAAASGGLAATATRTTDANPHVSQASWPNGYSATYRIAARMKVSANSASLYGKTGSFSGATVAGLANTTYGWVDLGEFATTGGTLEIHGWMSGGAGTLSVDRIEAVLVQDRVAGAAFYGAARDRAQAALVACRKQIRRPGRASL